MTAAQGQAAEGQTKQEQTLEARRFLTGFAGAAVAALLAWVALVLAFDPYLAFGTRLLPRSVILPASRMLGDEQLIKDHLFARQRPGTVIIGSSRSVYGLDPRDPGLSGENAFNLSMLGASLTDLEGLSAIARRNNTHVKRLIIGIDHYMFFQKSLDQKQERAAQVRIRRMETGHGPVPVPLQYAQTFLLSTRVGRVMEDMLDNWRRRDTLGEADVSGLMHGTYRFRIADRSRTFEVTLRSLFEQGWYSEPDDQVIASRLRRLAGLIRSTCQAGIRVDALFSPEHAMLHEAAVLTGQQARREQLRRDMSRMMGLLAGEQPDCLRYRDASGLSGAATEPLRLAAGAKPQFIEVSHYAPVVGSRLIEGFRTPGDPGALGIDTAQANQLERDILTSRLMLDEWRTANPGDAAFVRRVHDAAGR
jgi:hypothetical protein